MGTIWPGILAVKMEQRQGYSQMKGNDMKKYIIIIFMLIGIIACQRKDINNDIEYHLRANSYSADKLLYLESIFRKADDIDVFIGCIDLKKMEKLVFMPLTPGPYDFSWDKNGMSFLVTHGDRMTLYKKRGERDSCLFIPIAIACPTNAMYLYCEGNINSNKVAITWYSTIERENCYLGIYDFNNNTFSDTDILVDLKRVCWKNNEEIVYIKDGKVNTVNILTNKTAASDHNADILCGLINNKLVAIKERRIMLDDLELCSFRDNLNNGVVVSRDFIFAAFKDGEVFVFDKNGKKVGYAQNLKSIKLGSLGEEPNVVYGLQEGSIIKMVYSNNQIKVHNIITISDAKTNYKNLGL